MVPWINPTAARDMLNSLAAFSESGSSAPSLTFYDQHGRVLLAFGIAPNVFQAAERTVMAAFASLTADTAAERTGQLHFWRLMNRDGVAALIWPATGSVSIGSVVEGVNYNLSGFSVRMLESGALAPSVVVVAVTDPGV